MAKIKILLVFLSFQHYAALSPRAVFYLFPKVVYNKINMDTNEFYEFEDRAYINPTLSKDEQLGFVDTLRDTVGRNTAQINAQTKALGSDLPSTQGGLTGSNSYFQQRYQTTPIEAQANTLKATAQAKALSDLMANYQNQAQNRYNQAYRAAKKRASNTTTPTTTVKGDVEYVDEGYEDETPPPNTEDYYKTYEEVRETEQEKTRLPSWLLDVLNVFGYVG